MPPPTDMTVPVAAAALGCSPPTVRKLVRDSLLPAMTRKRGNRTFFTLRTRDVEAFVEEHGKFHTNITSRRGSQSPRTATIAALTAEVASLRQTVEGQTAQPPRYQETAESESALRAEVVSLREAVQLQRAAVTALNDADQARSEGTQLMLEAMQAFQAADTKRRDATRLLDEIIGSITLPGNAAELVRDDPHTRPHG